MLCAIAKLDSAAQERLMYIAESVMHFGLTPKRVYGHITLATYISGDEGELLAYCKEALRAQPPITVYYDALKIISTNCIVVAPCQTQELTALYSRLQTRYTEYLDEWTRGGAWLPHTTLAYHPTADLNAMLYEMNKRFAPFEAKISCVDFSRVTDSGYEILGCVDLGRICANS